MTPPKTLILLLAFLMPLSACNDRYESACDLLYSKAAEAEMFFGRSQPDGGTIDDEAFARFVEKEIIPRWPDGFTLLDGTGYWRGNAEKTAKENVAILKVIGPHNTDFRAKLELLAKKYRQIFGQEAVLFSLKGVDARLCAAPKTGSNTP